MSTHCAEVSSAMGEGLPPPRLLVSTALQCTLVSRLSQALSGLLSALSE